MKISNFSHPRSFRSFCASHRTHEGNFSQAFAPSSFGIAMGCVVPTRMSGFNANIVDGIHMEEANGFDE
ncbi:hypothetical protein VN12_26130 [Pirellula sp. SH-Sr6A]|nr:hypothetical protein VN12_26130 [Pirellula sp. SH-Sr6A]